LAAVAADSVALTGAVDGGRDVQLVVRAANEGGGVLGVEGAGNVVEDHPGEDRKPEEVAGAERSVGGMLVVEVAGVAAVVEDQQHRGVDNAGDTGDVVGEPVDGLGGEMTVGVVEELDGATPSALLGAASS